MYIESLKSAISSASNRVSELCNLDIHDVGENTVRVLGKGGKERIVPIERTSSDENSEKCAKDPPKTRGSPKRPIFRRLLSEFKFNFKDQAIPFKRNESLVSKLEGCNTVEH